MRELTPCPDFSHLAEGIAILHAIYDVQNNSAYVNIGTGPVKRPANLLAIRSGVGGITEANMTIQGPPRFFC